MRKTKIEITYEQVGQDVLDLASEIIRAHHADLMDADITFIFRSQAATKGSGKAIWGRASKVPKRLKALLDYDFIIELAEDVYTGLNDMQRRALIDHELCHCHLDDFGKAILIHHDIEEFNSILERYGSWAPDIYVTAMTMQAMPLFPPNKPEHTGKVEAAPVEVVLTAKL